MDFKALDKKIKGKKVKYLRQNNTFAETTGFIKHTIRIPENQELTLKGVIYCLEVGMFCLVTEELSTPTNVPNLFLPACFVEVDGKSGHEWIMELMEKHGFPALPDNYAENCYITKEEMESDSWKDAIGADPRGPDEISPENAIRKIR